MNVARHDAVQHPKTDAFSNFRPCSPRPRHSRRRHCRRHRYQVSRNWLYARVSAFWHDHAAEPAYRPRAVIMRAEISEINDLSSRSDIDFRLSKTCRRDRDERIGTNSCFFIRKTAVSIELLRRSPQISCEGVKTSAMASCPSRCTPLAIDRRLSLTFPSATCTDLLHLQLPASMTSAAARYWRIAGTDHSRVLDTIASADLWRDLRTEQAGAKEAKSGGV